ncbi:MAG: adenylyltransferase/cytidyltransferase family protein [Minisyncoccia bacterium]
MDTTKKVRVVAVSGGFDPVHVGHVRMFIEAKKLGDKLVVILNNDNWLRAKKGYAFMPEAERKEVIESFGAVDEVILTRHEPESLDMSVCRELEMIRPHVFGNGGDRKHDNVPEYALCEKLGIEMAFDLGRGGKVQSSSWLLLGYMDEYPCTCGALNPATGKKYKYKECGLVDAPHHKEKKAAT